MTAQNHIDTHFIGKNKKTWEVEVDATVVVNTADKVSAKLTGPLIIKNDDKVEEITLEGHEITELTIINCPNVEKINVGRNKLTKIDITKLKTTNNNDDGDPALTNKLKVIVVGKNADLEEISLEYCPDLEDFTAGNCNKLDKVWGFDRLDKIKKVLVRQGLLNYIYQGKLKNIKGAKAVLRKLLGKGPEDPVDTSNINDLENQIQAVANPQAATAKANAEKEAKEAKQELDNVKTERDQLKQQLVGMIKELGLADNATSQQAIDKIKELMRRPTSGCSHTDYDAIKTERDSLKTDNESKKRKIAELEGNKENIDAITKKVMVEKTNTLFDNLNISSANKSGINSADSAVKVEEVRNEIIRSEFNRLKDKNNGSLYLSIGLGVLAIGSLLLLGWVLMRQQNNLLEKEPKKEKK